MRALTKPLSSPFARTLEGAPYTLKTGGVTWGAGQARASFSLLSGPIIAETLFLPDKRERLSLPSKKEDDTSREA